MIFYPVFPHALAVAVILLYSGCATLAPTEPFASAPRTEYAAERSVQTPAPVKEDGTAPSPLPGGKLTLEDCISHALNNNPEHLMAGAEVESARAQAKIQGGARWPNIGLTGSYFRHLNSQRLGSPTAPGAPMYYTDDIVSADVVIRMPLYTGGRIVNEFRAATLLSNAASHTFARSEEELIFNVKSTYFSILAQREVIESTEFSREVLSQHLARTEELIETRKAAPVDALRTEVRLAEVEHQLLEERNRYEIQHRLLVNLMGVDDGKAREIELAGELSRDEARDEENVREFVRRAFRQRPDYAAALAEVEAQAKRVDAARGEREPTVSFEAAYGGRWGIGASGGSSGGGAPSLGINAAGEPSLSTTSSLPGGGSLASTWGSDGFSSARFTPATGDGAESFRDSGRIGVTVDVPIFEGGQIQASIAKERAQFRAAQQRLRRLELEIMLEVETAVSNVTSAFERVRVAEKSIAEAEESLKLERQKYTLGRGAVVDVLDAEEALLQAQTNYHGALADYQIAKAELQLAAGEKRS
ncbi:MAG: TolC family protein [Candidatus Hydrogenedentota bacterium]